MAVYEAGILGLAGAFCFFNTITYHLSLSKAILALFNSKTLGCFLAVWALQVGLMEGMCFIAVSPGLYSIQCGYSVVSSAKHGVSCL